MNKFNVGDKVKIKQKEVFDYKTIHETVFYITAFEDYCGQVATVTGVEFYDYRIPYYGYKINLDDGEYYWHESQFELVERKEQEMKNELYFAKVRPTAIIPSKRDEDAV